MTYSDSNQLVRPRHVVTAVLVAHDGARWLPTTLQAVRTQRRPVQRFVAVDTGSRDETRELLEAVVGESSVIEAPRGTGFGAAVKLALQAFERAPGLAYTARAELGSPVEWVWLLHDDSAPTPDALAVMLELADDMPSAGVIGPKLRGWHDHRVLLEAGVTTDRGGRRETGLEPGELDHGQHDGDRDVLAVSTAGMLVRRDVWDALGGFDPALPLFRDDIDFGWRANLAGHRVIVCSRAVVHHAEAAASGARRVSAASPRRRRLDRQAALRTLLVNGPAGWLPLTGLRLLLACVLRALAFAFLKRPRDAWDELCAATAVFARPWEIRRARRARKAIRVVRAGDIRPLLAPRGSRLRYYADAAAARLAEIGRRQGEEPDERGFARRVLSQPGFLLFAALSVVALVAERHVLATPIWGGALLAAPRGASDLWQTYTAGWHATGFGSTAAAPPYLAVLAAVSFVLFGSARMAVAVLLLGAVPLAGATAYVSTRRLVSSKRLRIWLSASYALLPIATGSIAGGRLGTAVAFVLLPPVLSGLARALLPALRWAGSGARSAWPTALLLAVAAAFDPIVYVLLAPLVFVALVAGLIRRSWVAARRAVVLLVVPPALLLPWSWRVVRHPALLVLGVGQPSPQLQQPKLAPVDVLLLHPGGPGMPPVWLYVVVVLVAFAGLFQLSRPTPARLGWLVAIVGIAGGCLIARSRVTPLGGDRTELLGWPGTATAVVAAGLLLSAAMAAARLRSRLVQTSFGWRQPVALVLTVGAVATPLAAAGWWIADSTGPLLHTGSVQVLPAFVQAEAASDDHPRTVVLRPGADGTVEYAVLRDRAPRLGDADLPPDRSQVRIVDAAVADAAGGLGERAATELAHAGIRYVLVPASGAEALSARIAAGGGLLAQNTSGGWQVWQVEANAGRLAIAPAQDPVTAAWQLPRGSVQLGAAAGPVPISYDPGRRLLVLAEAPSKAWRAVIVGQDGGRTALAPTTVAGMQAFQLPPIAGGVVVSRAPDRRADWLVFELVALIVVILAGLPSGRRATARARDRQPDEQLAHVAVGASA